MALLPLMADPLKLISLGESCAMEIEAPHYKPTTFQAALIAAASGLFSPQRSTAVLEISCEPLRRSVVSLNCGRLAIQILAAFSEPILMAAS
jgi:hypothetical protein